MFKRDIFIQYYLLYLKLIVQILSDLKSFHHNVCFLLSSGIRTVIVFDSRVKTFKFHETLLLSSDVVTPECLSNSELPLLISLRVFATISLPT